MSAVNQYPAKTTAEPVSVAASILDRLETVARQLSDHADTLRGVENSVVGGGPPVGTEAGGPKPVFSYGGFLGQLDQVIAKIEGELSSASTTVFRVKNAF